LVLGNRWMLECVDAGPSTAIGGQTCGVCS
jgi:hypothetical protein